MPTPNTPLSQPLEEKLIRFTQALVDQKNARIVVPPQQSAPGFWFGGGNLTEDNNGTLFLTGRYRNAGDSRTGLAAGERGCELAIFTSKDRGQTFEKQIRFEKNDLNVNDWTVLSIEGTAMRHTKNGGVELFVSTEKQGIGYPPEFSDYLKPGTGVWTIERIQADSIDHLKSAPRETVLSSTDPRVIHLKDPFLYERKNTEKQNSEKQNNDNELTLFFCSHPFSWTSSNTGYANQPAASTTFTEPVHDFFPRGFTWDVAMTRGTAILDVPKIGPFAEQPVSLMFYDGGECVRNLDDHSAAVKRPRGYSCEELSSAAYSTTGNLSHWNRLAIKEPLFISPHGTGCSRYIDVLSTKEGFYTTWQQSQPNGSQPLVMNFLTCETANELLQ